MLINIPWSSSYFPEDLKKSGYRIIYPEPGAIAAEWVDPEGKKEGHVLYEFYPYAWEYPGIYWNHSSNLSGILKLFSPYHILTEYGFSGMFRPRWRGPIYDDLPSLYGQADTVEQILEYGDIYVRSPLPFILTIFESPYSHKAGRYLSESDDPDEYVPPPEGNILHFHWHLLGLSPWREKREAVERLMKREIHKNIKLEDIEYGMLEPLDQQLRLHFEEIGIDLQEQIESYRRLMGDD